MEAAARIRSHSSGHLVRVRVRVRARVRVRVRALLGVPGHRAHGVGRYSGDLGEYMERCRGDVGEI